jgi:HAMP domain-containing protein
VAARISLSTRIFLASAGIVAVVLLVALFVTERSAQRAAEASVSDRLDIARKRVTELVGAEGRLLANRLSGYAASPDFRSGVEAATDPGDYLDRAQTVAEEIGAEWVQLVGRDGVRLAKSDDPSAPPDTLLGTPLVTKALDGETMQAFGVAGDTILTHVVSVPIKGSNDRIIGALMAAKFLSDSIARAVGTETQSDIFFFALTGGDELRITGTTDGLRQVGDPQLVQVAQQVQEADAVSADTSGGVQQAGARRDSLAKVEFGGEHYVGRSGALLTSQQNLAGGFVALRSLERELRATGFTNLRNTVLLAGAGGMIAALLFALLTTRQVTRPVRVLAEATRRAAEGDYQAVIPEGGRDEIGTLSSAFRRLLSDLRDKQALVDLLSNTAASAPGATVSMSPNAPTMKLAMAGAQVITPGSTIGNRYQVTSVLGVGGMGVVYKAQDRELGEPVAIKTLKPEMMAMDSSALERFKSEIKLARRISHRNVVRTHDLGEMNGLYYITMEFVEGTSLKDLIRARGRLPASAVLPIAKQLCRALEVAHDEGVIHRDIKPQNMVVQGDGVLKVMDFGIARLASRAPESGHTQAGMIVGTPEYMSPEQLAGDELDGRADLYATGCVLYECLTGDVPLTADTPITLIAKVLDETPVAPSVRYADIPAELSDLVMWTLAKSREERPASAADLYKRLDAITTA